MGHKKPANWALQWKVEHKNRLRKALKNEVAFLRRGLWRVRVWRLAAQRTVTAGWVDQKRPTRRRAGQA